MNWRSFLRAAFRKPECIEPSVISDMALNLLKTLTIGCCVLFSSTSLPSQQQSDLETQRLFRVSQREQKLQQQIAGNPDFFTPEELEQKFGEIAFAYSNYLLDNPDDVEALILYGKLLRQLGEEKRAFDIFLKADELDPNIAVIKQQIGNYLVETGNGKAALTFYLNAIAIDPEIPEYNYALGEILHAFRPELLNDGIYTPDALDREMLKAFRAAAQLAPDNFDMQMRLGESYYDLNNPDWKAALLHWEKLRKATPDYNELRCQILDLHSARALVKLGEIREAKLLLDKIDQTMLQKTHDFILKEITQKQEPQENLQVPLKIRQVQN